MNRRRHPCDKGKPMQHSIGAALRWLLCGHTWRRHPAPFNKTPRGKARRAARKFVWEAKHVEIQR